MTAAKTIVFGPTGHVGSATALFAQKRGAKVSLAMRDPQKPIPGLTPEQEQQGGFERVQADLTSPESIRASVNKAGAKHAFIYIARGAPDGMKASIEALKSAGIEFVVFLSSDGIREDIREVSPSNFVGYTHAQIELNLLKAFGPAGYVAVRPTYYASNSFAWKAMVRDGEVKIPYPEVKFDWISPDDIGAVCGALLAGGRKAIDDKTEKNFVRINGPLVLSQREAVGIIGKAVGKNLKVTELDYEEGLKSFLETGMPEPVAKQLMNAMKLRAEQDYGQSVYEGPDYEEAAASIEKYTGQRPTKFDEWADKYWKAEVNV